MSTTHSVPRSLAFSHTHTTDMMRSLFYVLVTLTALTTALATGVTISEPALASSHPAILTASFSTSTSPIILPAARSDTASRTSAGAVVIAMDVAVPAVGTTSLNFATTTDRDGAYSWPTQVPVPVINAYSPGPHNWDAGHRGVDLAAANGEQIFSATDGTVIYASTIAERGVVSILDSRGIRTTYEPLKPAVHLGDHVRRGEFIGTIDGYHCGVLFACLHWGAKRGRSDYLNPLWLLNPPRVRLIE